jgi:hypothetical protein
VKSVNAYGQLVSCEVDIKLQVFILFLYSSNVTSERMQAGLCINSSCEFSHISDVVGPVLFTVNKMIYCRYYLLYSLSTQLYFQQMGLLSKTRCFGIYVPSSGPVYNYS